MWPIMTPGIPLNNSLPLLQLFTDKIHENTPQPPKPTKTTLSAYQHKNYKTENLKAEDLEEEEKSI